MVKKEVSPMMNEPERDNPEIPDNLEEVIQKGIAKGRFKYRRNLFLFIIRKVGYVLAVCFLAIIFSLIFSPAFASVVSDLPVIRELSRVFLLRCSKYL